MKNKILFLVLIIFCEFLAVKISLADLNRVDLYFFYSQGCPYCAKAEIFLNQLKREQPGLEVVSFEVSGNQENRKLYLSLANAYQVDASYVPSFFIGDKALIGYDDFIGSQIKTEILRCLNQKCFSPLEKLLSYQSKQAATGLKDKTKQNISWWTVFGFGLIILILILLFIFLKKKNKT